MRLINADAILPRLKFISEAEHQIYGEASWGFVRKCIAVVEDAPTEEPERKTGHWVITSKFDDCCYARCDQCNITQVFYFGKPTTNYCPNCGSYNGGA